MTQAPCPAPSGIHDDLQLGYEPMDRVHETFVGLIDALQRVSGCDVAPALAALAEHARDHFEEENTWMNTTDFPARDCHVAEHAAVLQSILGVSARVARGDHSAVGPLARELASWFPAHCHYLDAPLAHWMCKERWGAKPLVLHRRPAAQSAAVPTEPIL